MGTIYRHRHIWKWIWLMGGVKRCTLTLSRYVLRWWASARDADKKRLFQMTESTNETQRGDIFRRSTTFSVCHFFSHFLLCFVYYIFRCCWRCWNGVDICLRQQTRFDETIYHILSWARFVFFSPSQNAIFFPLFSSIDKQQTKRRTWAWTWAKFVNALCVCDTCMNAMGRCPVVGCVSFIARQVNEEKKHCDVPIQHVSRLWTFLISCVRALNARTSHIVGARVTLEMPTSEIQIIIHCHVFGFTSCPRRMSPRAQFTSHRHWNIPAPRIRWVAMLLTSSPPSPMHACGWFSYFFTNGLTSALYFDKEHYIWWPAIFHRARAPGAIGTIRMTLTHSPM